MAFKLDVQLFCAQVIATALINSHAITSRINDCNRVLTQLMARRFSLTNRQKICDQRICEYKNNKESDAHNLRASNLSFVRHQTRTPRFQVLSKKEKKNKHVTKFAHANCENGHRSDD